MRWQKFWVSSPCVPLQWPQRLGFSVPIQAHDGSGSNKTGPPPTLESQALNSMFLFPFYLLICFSGFHYCLLSLSFCIYWSIHLHLFHNPLQPVPSPNVRIQPPAQSLNSTHAKFLLKWWHPSSSLYQDFFGVESYQWHKNWHFSGYPARHLAL